MSNNTNKRTCQKYNKSEAWNSFHDKPTNKDLFESLTEKALVCIASELSKNHRSVKRLQYDTFYLYNNNKYIDVDGCRKKVERKFVPFSLSKNFCKKYSRTKDKHFLRADLVFLYDLLENFEYADQMTFSFCSKTTLREWKNDKRKRACTIQKTQYKTYQKLISTNLEKLENIDMIQVLQACRKSFLEFVSDYCTFWSLNYEQTSIKMQEILNVQARKLREKANMIEKSKLETTRNRIQKESFSLSYQKES